MINIKKPNIDQGSENYIMLAITLSTLIFFGIFIIRPSLTLVTLLNQKAKEYKELSIKLDEKISNLEKIKGENKDISVALRLLDKAIPQTANESDILNNINYVASKNNINLSNISFTFKEDAPEIEIQMKAVGTFENSVSMFKDMSNLLTPVSISSIKMSPDSSTGENIIKMDISAKSYYQKI